MKQFDDLTNERLGKMFENQFELVNYAIKLAEHFIRSGREPFIQHNLQNLATQILDVIESGKDKFEKIPDEATFIAEVEQTLVDNHVTVQETEVVAVEVDSEDDSEEKAETVEAM